MKTILAHDPARRTNAQAIADAHQLGWLRVADRVLDLTYNEGRFWTLYRPHYLVTNDIAEKFVTDLSLDYEKSLDVEWDIHVDKFDVVVFDPPYGYRGSPRLDMDERYGLDTYKPVVEREAMFRDGLTTARRLRPDRILVKCQDQVVSGKKRWQRMMFAEWAAAVPALAPTYRLADELYVAGMRSQSSTTQKHARQNFSTLQLYVKDET